MKTIGFILLIFISVLGAKAQAFKNGIYAGVGMNVGLFHNQGYVAPLWQTPVIGYERQIKEKLTILAEAELTRGYTSADSSIFMVYKNVFQPSVGLSLGINYALLHFHKVNVYTGIRAGAAVAHYQGHLEGGDFNYMYESWRGTRWNFLLLPVLGANITSGRFFLKAEADFGNAEAVFNVHKVTLMSAYSYVSSAYYLYFRPMIAAGIKF
jgi:hypothetical protein